MQRLLALLALSTGALFAQTPVITTIQNNYARVAEGASNYGIAQGSIFIVKGTNLSAQADTTLQNTPLQTTLANVRVRITMNGVITYAPIYYVLSIQIAAILPSNIPEGNGTVIIEKNGVNSAPAPLKVVKSAYGMLAWDFENGTGRAIVVKTNGTFAGNNASDTGNVLNPNDVVLLFGSGLGPITGSDATAPTPGNFDNISISISIGGVNAEVQYHGRSTFAGLDQINVKIPALAANAYSCSVAMVNTTNNVVANATTIPVAATGTTCTNQNTGGGGETSYPGLSQSEINAILGRGAFKTGTLTIGRTRSYIIAAGQTTTTTSDSADGNFVSISGSDLQKLLNGTLPLGFTLPAAGVCNVFDGFAAPNAASNLTYTGLDAGASLTAQGPAGTTVMTKSAAGGFITYSGTMNSSPAGRYTFAGTGGPGVPAFSLGLDVPTELVWTNRASLTEVTRSNGATVTWSGGEPGTLVQIIGISIAASLSGGNPTAKGFICYANQSAGQFAIPGSVLNQLPATTSVSGFFLTPGTLSITGQGKYATTAIAGIDQTVATSSTITLQTMIYK